MVFLLSLSLAADSILPHVNASLNLAACILLLTGFFLIKAGKEKQHKLAMLSCFVVSCIFLVCYITYHYLHGDTPFPRDEYPQVAVFYYVLLITHIVLAALVPFLAVATILFGLLDKRPQHRFLARITFPIWIYVSVTGVLVYLMLYWWYVPTTVS